MPFYILDPKIFPESPVLAPQKTKILTDSVRYNFEHRDIYLSGKIRFSEVVPNAEGPINTLDT